MLKKFFLNVLSSFMGAWLAIVMSGLCLVLVIFGIAAIAMGGRVNIEKDSVLKIDLSGELVERFDASTLGVMEIIQGAGDNVQSVETIVAALREAKDNKNVKAVYLDCGQLASAPASADAVREALVDFKSSGKKVYAYADQYSQSAYFIATAADEICVNPVGSVDLHGLGGESLFYKDLFDKIGVEFQVVRVGEGKSAVEPYTQNAMSDYARSQTMELLDTIWGGLNSTISTSRGLTAAAVDSMIDNELPAIQTGTYALEHKLADKTAYRREFEAELAKRVGVDVENLKYVSPQTLAMTSGAESFGDGGDKEIAVVYACGGIDDMMGGGGINSRDLVKQITELGNDDDVKGMVLRVNSPGGSAFGSEQIWEAIEWFKKKGKPVAVSMGDYAASGGYYISCGAGRIFADRLTITGSIGIFGLIPNVKGLLDKIGVNPEMVATNPNAQLFTLMQPLDTMQMKSMQNMVQQGYDLFVKRCADGRHTTVENIKKIADGRPIAATVALRYGLIDQIGSLRDAVKWTALQAKLGDKYSVGVYPGQETNIFAQMYYSGNSSIRGLLPSIEASPKWDEALVTFTQTLLRADRMRAEYKVVEVKL